VKRRLVLSWVRDAFWAAHLCKGKDPAVWRAPKPVPDLPAFNWALADAVQALGVRRGEEVVIVHESERVSHPLLTVPPMRLRDLLAYLERKVGKEKPFEGPAAWGFTQGAPSRNGRSVLLHVAPQKFVEATARICLEFGLCPVAWLPLPDAMGLQLQERLGRAEEVGMLVALFPSQCEVLVGRGDGQVLFVRDLSFRWKDDPERLAVELRRSLLFATQRFGVQVDKGWILGEDASQALRAVQQTVPAILEAINAPAMDWRMFGAGLNPRRSSNMLPASIRERRRRRWLARAWVAVSFAGILGGIGTVAFVEYLIASQPNDATGSVALQRLQAEREALQERFAEADRLRQKVLALQAAAREADAPALLARWIAATLPQRARLQRFVCERDGDGWRIALQGVIRGSDAQAFASTVERIQRALTHAPVHAAWAHDWRKALVHAWRSSPTEPAALRFSLQGHIP